MIFSGSDVPEDFQGIVQEDVLEGTTIGCAKQIISSARFDHKPWMQHSVGCTLASDSSLVNQI